MVIVLSAVTEAATVVRFCEPLSNAVPVADVSVKPTVTIEPTTGKSLPRIVIAAGWFAGVVTASAVNVGARNVTVPGTLVTQRLLPKLSVIVAAMVGDGGHT